MTAVLSFDRVRRTLAATSLVMILVSSCGDDSGAASTGGEAPATTSTTAATTGAPGLYPDVVEATITPGDDGTVRIDATLSSPYDSPQRYADAWRVLGPDGTVLGVRELTHDHANEQPFTRSLTDVVLPDTVTEVTIEGRDSQNGWGGRQVTVAVP